MSTISCQQRQFGTLDTGQAITCYSLRNTSGMTVNLLNYGAILSTVQIPDLRGDMHEITLGTSDLGNLKNPALSGSTLLHLPTRYGVTLNEPSQRLWEAESMTHDKAASVKLSCKGMLDLKYSAMKLEYQCMTEYTLTTTDELIIQSSVNTSLSLPVFMTHHPIWNLTGGSPKEVNDHVLQVSASQYSKVDTTGFSESEFLDISDQPAFNFQQPQRVGEKYAQIPKETPYDVCFKLKEREIANNEPPATGLAAYVKAPVSGRILEIYTNQPGLRFCLNPNDQGVLEGLCLSPMPLLSAAASGVSTSEITQQETRYKLIW